MSNSLRNLSKLNLNSNSRLLSLNASSLRWATSVHNFSTTKNRNKPGSVLNIHNLNKNIINLEYAVRGPIVLRAVQIENEMKRGIKKPFDQVIRANIGDCHATGQKPITFIRDVMTLCTKPELLNDPRFPEDAKQRAKRILADCKGASVGSYTESEGINLVRKDVAHFIQERDDGIPSRPEDVYITSGASDGIKTIMEILLTNNANRPPGFLIPIPQYPLYSALISEFSAYQISYYLDEEEDWALDTSELERAYKDSLPHCEPRAICIINPGNPTGQVLSRKNIEQIIKWAYEKNLYILADEVYQDNVYIENRQFHSFKKVAVQLGPPYCNMEIASFYSTSKGYMGECGSRCGFMEVINMDPEVKLHLEKLISAHLCPPAVGQACLDAIMCPPKPGEPSYQQFIAEKNEVLNNLKVKADLITKLFNSIEGIKCNPVEGAMYAFPKITIPKRAVEKAKSLNLEPDVFYCFQLLEATGICVVPGSGFHQREGTFHFRTTILPPVDQIKSLLQKLKEFQHKFLQDWA